MALEEVSRRGLLATAGAGAALSLLGVRPGAGGFLGQAATAPAPPPSPSRELLFLTRTSFGPRPEDLARVSAIGIEAYLDEQLQPERIDDSAVDREVARAFPTVVRLPAGPFEGDARHEIAIDLKSATLYRAVASRRQLFEVLVDFWSNHFNIYHQDGPTSVLKTADDREVIRRHALGRFRDLLGASARSPAMLVFLDNFTNIAGGPNENYARELMELHTLGVEGGYTQADVQDVARAFTGWTIERRDGRQFRFDARSHDQGAKRVLGVAIPAGGGQRDGEIVLDRLATHPSTARFIATKLCRRFLADTPPAAAVDAAALTFTTTGGDLRETVRTVLHSAQLFESADAKVRRPIEVLAAAVRALPASASTDAARLLLHGTKLLGQAPFNWPAPNGYPDAAGAWINTNGLLGRWNLMLRLAGGRAPGVRIDWPAWVRASAAATPTQLVDALTDRLLHRALLAADRNALIAHAAAGGPGGAHLPVPTLAARAPEIAALLLDSPYFQWR